MLFFQGGQLRLGSLLLFGAGLYLIVLLVLQLTSSLRDGTLLDIQREETRVKLHSHVLRRTLNLKSSHMGDPSQDLLNEEITIIYQERSKGAFHKHTRSDLMRKINNSAKGMVVSVGSNVTDLTLIDADSTLNLVPPRYNMLINQPFLCHQVDSDDVPTPHTPNKDASQMAVNLLIIVHSHPLHRRRRDAIRATWGRIIHHNYETKQTVLLFLLGIPGDYEEYQRVHKEAKLYRDVVVYEFVDDYRNLTVKSLLGLYWSATFCENAKYIIKADDDVYLNVPEIINTLNGVGDQNLILGSRNLRSPVRRYGQWAVTYKDYPQPLFPPYCSGCMYTLSGDMAAKLYHVSQNSESPAMISIEDVYITGLLAQRLGVRCMHHERFPSWITVLTLPHVLQYLRGEVFGLHGMGWIHMHGLQMVTRRCTNCTTDPEQARRWFTWLMDQDTMYG